MAELEDIGKKIERVDHTSLLSSHWLASVLLVVSMLSLFAFTACGGNDGETAAAGIGDAKPDQRVIQAGGRILTVDDFISVGFKQLKTYDVEGLPGATAASYGFWRAEGQKAKDIELRFYLSHEEAVRDGTELAQEVTGRDAIIFVDDMTWKEGARDRRRHAIPGGYFPAYMDYSIFGNVVMLCEGSDSSQSMENCGKLATAITDFGE